MAEIFEVKLDATKFNQLARELPGKLIAGLTEELRKFMLFFLEDLREERLSGNPIHRRTKRLSEDGTVVVVASQTEIDARAVFSLPYAATQEYGDPDRRPTHAQFLSIPLAAAKTPAGVPRWGSPLRQTLKADFESTFARRSQHGTGSLILFGVKTKGTPPIPLFVLKRSVNIPARMGARELFAKQVAELPKKLNARMGTIAAGGAK